MTLGEMMKRKRRALGLSATESAHKAGMSLGAWSNYETNRSRRKDGSFIRPRPETLRSIAFALDTPEEEIFAAAYEADLSKENDLVEFSPLWRRIPVDKRPNAKEAIRQVLIAFS